MGFDETIVLEQDTQHELTVHRYRHEIATMDDSGDTKTIWDPRNEAEVEVAREAFKALRKKGYAIYRVGKDGEKGRVMSEFDPEAEKMIAVPAIVGG